MGEPPKLATALLRRIVANQPALVGDLLEQFRSGRSKWWYWRQVVAIVAAEMSRTVRPSLGWSALAATAVVLLLEVPLLFHVPAPADFTGWLLVALYLAPQAIVIAVPVGLAIGTVIASRPRMSAPAMSLVLIGAIFVSLVTFAVEGWLVPASNQAYRLLVGGPDALRGAAELTFGELRSLMIQSNENVPGALVFAVSDPRNMAMNYYARFALAFAPVAFSLLRLWTANLDCIRRRVVVVAVTWVYVAYVFVGPEWLRALPPVLAAWLPIATVAAAAVGVRAVRGAD